MTGNGLFEKAKLAKEESKNAQDDEDRKITEYCNEINLFSGRNTLSSQVVLYENNNPTFDTSNITLNQDIDNYNRFTIYCCVGDKSVVKYFEIYEKGKKVLLDGGYSFLSGYYRDASIIIQLPTTGRTVTFSDAHLEQNGSAFDQCCIAIYKIVGYTD